MANDVMLQMGAFQFSIKTAAYQSIRRSKFYRWAAQDRVGSRPARQFVGQGDETIVLPGTIYPGKFGTVDQVQKMREEADKGEPLQIVASSDASNGDVLGLWVIESVEETGSIFLSNGQPLRIDFEVSIVHYGDDQDSNGSRSSFGAGSSNGLAGFIDSFF